MRKILMIAMMAVTAISTRAGEDDLNFNIGAGYLYENNLNAEFSVEKELRYGHAIALFFEAGNKMVKDPICGKYCKDTFWNNYYWDGGAIYKHCLTQWKNSLLRINLGPNFGAVTGDFFLGFQLNLEYDIYFYNRWALSITQKNQVGFLSGDTFRNGLMIGLKIPF